MDAEARVIREGRSWHDRLTGPAPRRLDPPGTFDDAAWQTWRRVVDPDDAGLFARRLEWDGLDDDAALALLAGGDCNIETWWLPELRRLRQACRVRGERASVIELSDLPFDRLLAPMVADVWQRFAADAPGAWLEPLSNNAVAALRHDLGQRFAQVVAHAWYADFVEGRTAGATLMLQLGDGTRPADTRAYTAWCDRQLDDGLEHLLSAFPVLGRLLPTVSRQWQTATADLLEQTCRHRPGLAATFGIPVDSRIGDFRTGRSDPHRGGRTVSFIDFETSNGRRSVVHKPKDLRIERRFQELVRTVNGSFAEYPLDTITVLCGDEDYGFTSLVEWRECRQQDLPGFYVSAGRMLALLYLLGATDCHYENVIATGRSLALLDAETLFHSRSAFIDPATEVTESADSLTESVLRTGMLPGWLLAGPDQAAYDPSALGVTPPPSARTIPGWAHLNTDSMVWSAVPSAAEAPLSLPLGPGRPNPLPDHIEHLVRGFEEVHRAVRSEPLASEMVAAIDGFRLLPRRLVLRATRVYSVVQRHALSADALTSANRRAMQLELLSRSSLVSGQRDPHWAVFHAELAEMENLDVPFFEHHLGGHDVWGSMGAIAGLVNEDGIDEALSRVAELDDDDLSWQVRLIRGAVHARQEINDRGSDAGGADAQRKRDPGGTPVPPERLSDLARVVAAELATAATPDPVSGGPTWLSLSLLPDGRHTRLGLVSSGFYDGRLGIAAAEQWAGDLGFARPLADWAVDVASPVLATVTHADDYVRFRFLRNVGLGFSGVGGLLRFLALPTGDRVVADSRTSVRDDVVERFPRELIDRDRVLDMIGGVAGLVRPLADLVRQRPDGGAVELLARAAEHLAEAQAEEGAWPSAGAVQPLTGLAHGAAGCGLALFEAGSALRRADFIEAGAKAFRYEAACFDPRVGNWPDYRSGARGHAFMTAWCHGAPGIGLTRMRALQLAGDHPEADSWQRDLDAAMLATASDPDPGTDHLCCGLTGRAAVLRIVGRAQGRQDWLAAADRLTAATVARRERSGRFSLPFDVPDSPEPISPGLMTGLAGIGVHLMATAQERDLGLLLL